MFIRPTAFSGDMAMHMAATKLPFYFPPDLMPQQEMMPQTPANDNEQPPENDKPPEMEPQQRNDNMSVLDAIGRRHGTDKAAGGHNYCVFYERFLSEMRDQDLSIMEIGVASGGSVRLWRDYFQNARIVGFDIDTNANSSAEERIKIEIGDQNNLEDLHRCATSHGPFDLILDDGGHQPEAQMFSLTALLEFVKPGRFYILEDVERETVIHFLNQIAFSVMKNSSQWSRVESISFYEQTTVLRMKT